MSSLWKVPNEQASYSPDIPRAPQAGEIKGLERAMPSSVNSMRGLDLLRPMYLPEPQSVQWADSLVLRQ